MEDLPERQRLGQSPDDGVALQLALAQVDDRRPHAAALGRAVVTHDDDYLRLLQRGGRPEDGAVGGGAKAEFVDVDGVVSPPAERLGEGGRHVGVEQQAAHAVASRS